MVIMKIPYQNILTQQKAENFLGSCNKSHIPPLSSKVSMEICKKVGFYLKPELF